GRLWFWLAFAVDPHGTFCSGGRGRRNIFIVLIVLVTWRGTLGAIKFAQGHTLTAGGAQEANRDGDKPKRDMAFPDRCRHVASWCNLRASIFSGRRDRPGPWGRWSWNG